MIRGDITVKNNWIWKESLRFHQSTEWLTGFQHPQDDAGCNSKP